MSKRVHKFYDNHELIHSPDGRILRILAEYIGPQKIFKENNVQDTVVFFGSARIKPQHEAEKAYEIAVQNNAPDIDERRRDLEMSRYYEAARELAAKLTTWSKSLKNGKRRFIITTGGGPGIMEAANKGASEAGGLTVGLNISLPFEQSGNPYISRHLEMEFHYFFMRKYWFMYLAKALVVFPGGFGTLDELFETLTLIQTGKVHKDLSIVMFGKTFWERLIKWDVMVESGTISKEDLDLVYLTDDVEEAYQFLVKRLNAAYL